MQLSRESVLSMNLPETFIPLPLRPEIVRYLEDGRATTSSLLAAILDNDLRLAVMEGGKQFSQHIPSIVRWLTKYATPKQAFTTNARIGYVDAHKRSLVAA